jgi:hypothetical protein
MPVTNTSAEEARLPVGTGVATVETQRKAEDPNETESNLRVNGLGIYTERIDPKVKEQYRRVSKLLEDKLQHLSPKDREILKPVHLNFQDLFKKN